MHNVRAGKLWACRRDERAERHRQQMTHSSGRRPSRPAGEQIPPTSSFADQRLPVATTVSVPNAVPSRADFSTAVHPSIELTSSNSHTRRAGEVWSITRVSSRPNVSARRRSRVAKTSHGSGPSDARKRWGV